MLDDYKEKQPLFYNYAKKILKDKKIAHAYLIETNGVSYGLDLALALSKSFLCDDNYLNNKKCKKCNICQNIGEGNYPDVKIIETNSKEIKKEQLIQLQHEFSTKPIYGKYLIYIIKDANLLNKSSANTILKFLEEPNANIIAILLTDNIYNCIETIVSRCQILSLIPEELMNKNIFKKYCPDSVELEDYILEETKNIIEYYKDLEDTKRGFLLAEKLYDYKDKIDLLLQVGLLLYMNCLRIRLNLDANNFKKYFLDCQEIAFKIEDTNDIIKKIDLINQFLENNKFNVNKELFIDNFVIMFSGGINEN